MSGQSAAGLLVCAAAEAVVVAVAVAEAELTTVTEFVAGTALPGFAVAGQRSAVGPAASALESAALVAVAAGREE